MLLEIKACGDRLLIRLLMRITGSRGGQAVVEPGSDLGNRSHAATRDRVDCSHA